MPSKTKPKPATAITSIKDLQTDPHNANKGTPRGRAMLENSVRRFGIGRSVLADKHGRLIAGNTTTETVMDVFDNPDVIVVQSDGTKLVVVQRTDLDMTTDLAARELAVADNRVGSVGLEWDVEVLKQLKSEGADLSGMWSDDELAELFEATEPQGGLTDPDDVPAERATDIVSGDLFDLGQNRLICGDCTLVSDVARLMLNSRAGLMNTDPPYGIAYQNEDLHPDAGPIRTKVKNDDKEGAAIQPFLESAFRTAKAVALNADAAWYLWHGMLTQGFFAAAAAAAANVVLHRQIIWVKPVLVFGRGQYHWKHELCFMGWVDGHQPPDYGLGAGERTQTTVWEIDSVSRSDRKEFNHSTPKPVGLFTIPIVKHLKSNESAYEPFAGTGPQFIAAEQLGRRCFGIEIDPVFCDVIIRRWETFTGQKAVKVGEAVRA